MPTPGLMKNVIAVSKRTQTIFGTILSTDITGTAAGQFGHVNGYTIVPTQASNIILMLENAVLIYKFNTAAYTAGGNITINYTAGGAAQTGLISAANSVGAASDKYVNYGPLAGAASNFVAGAGFSLVSSAAFTQPGTAAGVIRYIATFNVFDITA